jgi:hypothetical protein
VEDAKRMRRSVDVPDVNDELPFTTVTRPRSVSETSHFLRAGKAGRRGSSAGAGSQ